MFNEGTQVISSAKEAMRNESTRWEVYRLAVQHGFYNEGPMTIGYRGFQLVPDGANVLVFQHGTRLITVTSIHIAKVWVTCRLDNCGLVEANAKVQAE
jgi:hypothetical protein